MKSTMKSMLALMAGAMVFTACSDNEFENLNEQNFSALKPMTFTASMEGQGSGLRTAIDADGLSIKWEDGDKIAIFDGVKDADNNYAHEFTLTGGAGSTSGTFTGSAVEGAEVYYALYPYAESKNENRIPTRAEAEAVLFSVGLWAEVLDEWMAYLYDEPEYLEGEIDYWLHSSEDQAIIYAYLKGESLTLKSGVQQDGDKFEDVVLPAEQTATPGSADPKAMLMIAKSTDASTLQFKNVCAYIKVTPQFDCCAIALRSTDATKYLAGTMTVDYNEVVPTTTVTANGTNEVFLSGTITAGNDYYIAVCPEALTSGFTIEFLTADKSHYYARTSSKELGLARNNVTNLGEFTIGGKWSIDTPTSGTAGGHDWQLVSPTLKIATHPVQACTLNEVDNNLNLWGSDWELLSYDDFKSLIDAKALNNFKVSGIGVLKFRSFTMNVSEWDSTGFWFSTMKNATSRYYGNMYLGLITSESSNWWSYMIFYKYIGE